MCTICSVWLLVWRKLYTVFALSLSIFIHLFYLFIQEVRLHFEYWYVCEYIDTYFIDAVIKNLKHAFQLFFMSNSFNHSKWHGRRCVYILYSLSYTYIRGYRLNNSISLFFFVAHHREHLIWRRSIESEKKNTKWEFRWHGNLEWKRYLSCWFGSALIEWYRIYE